MYLSNVLVRWLYCVRIIRYLLITECAQNAARVSPVRPARRRAEVQRHGVRGEEAAGGHLARAGVLGRLAVDIQ